MTGAQKIGEDYTTDIGNGRVRHESTWELPDGRQIVRVLDQDLRTQEFSSPRFFEPMEGVPGPRAPRLGEGTGRPLSGAGVTDVQMPRAETPERSAIPLPMRVGGAIGAGLITRGAAARMGARGVAREIPGALTAAGFDAMTGGDLVESALTAASVPAIARVGGYVGEQGLRALDGTMDAYEAGLRRMDARSPPAALRRANQELAQDPTHMQRVRAFAQTLEAEPVRPRRIGSRGYSSDAPLADGRALPVTQREAAEQGYYVDAPIEDGVLSQRSEFLNATPLEQSAWMDRVGFGERPRPPAPADRIERGRQIQAQVAETPQPRRLGQPEAERGMPPMNRRTRGERTPQNVARRAATRPAGQTLDGFIDAARRQGIEINPEGGTVAAKARAISDAVRGNPRLEQLARDWGLAALLTAGVTGSAYVREPREATAETAVRRLQ